jgi:hypothetical protein
LGLGVVRVTIDPAIDDRDFRCDRRFMVDNDSIVMQSNGINCCTRLIAMQDVWQSSKNTLHHHQN